MLIEHYFGSKLTFCFLPPGLSQVTWRNGSDTVHRVFNLSLITSLMLTQLFTRTSAKFWWVFVTTIMTLHTCLSCSCNWLMLSVLCVSVSCSFWTCPSLSNLSVFSLDTSSLCSRTECWGKQWNQIVNGRFGGIQYSSRLIMWPLCRLSSTSYETVEFGNIQPSLYIIASLPQRLAVQDHSTSLFWKKLSIAISDQIQMLSSIWMYFLYIYHTCLLLSVKVSPSPLSSILFPYYHLPNFLAVTYAPVLSTLS